MEPLWNHCRSEDIVSCGANSKRRNDFVLTEMFHSHKNTGPRIRKRRKEREKERFKGGEEESNIAAERKKDVVKGDRLTEPLVYWRCCYGGKGKVMHALN